MNSLADEIELLKEVYFKEFSFEVGLNGDYFLSIDVRPQLSDPDPNKYLVSLTLHVSCFRGYPEVPPKIMIDQVRGLEDHEIEKLHEDLRQIVTEKKGEPMIFDLIQHASNITESNLPHSACCICLEHFINEEDVYRTPAFHYFHRKCYARYLRNQKNEFDLNLNEILTNNPHTRKEELPKLEVLCPVCREILPFEEELVHLEENTDEDIAENFAISIPETWRLKREELAKIKLMQEEKALAAETEIPPESKIEEKEPEKNQCSRLNENYRNQNRYFNKGRHHYQFRESHRSYEYFGRDSSVRNSENEPSYYGDHSYHRKGGVTDNGQKTRNYRCSSSIKTSRCNDENIPNRKSNEYRRSSTNYNAPRFYSSKRGQATDHLETELSASWNEMYPECRHGSDTGQDCHTPDQIKYIPGKFDKNGNSRELDDLKAKRDKSRFNKGYSSDVPRGRGRSWKNCGRHNWATNTNVHHSSRGKWSENQQNHSHQKEFADSGHSQKADDDNSQCAKSN